MLSPNERAPDDDDATQATTQDSRWRAGVNRQAHPAAQKHQVAASQAAAAKRTSNAMSDKERKAKRAAHAREIYAQRTAERAAAAAVAGAEVAAAQLPSFSFLNELIDEDNHTRRNDGDHEPMDRCDDMEWAAFKKYITIDMWSEITSTDLEPDGFFDLFQEWRESDDYKQVILAWPMQPSQPQQPLQQPITPAAASTSCLQGPRQPSPPPPDDDDDDPYPGGADCYYESLEEFDNWLRRQRAAERAAKGVGPAPQPGDLQPGQSIDDWWDNFCDLEYSRAAGELPFNAIPFGNGIDASNLSRDLRAQAEDRQAQREASRDGTAKAARERAAGPPPRREQTRYGPRGDATGDEVFRKDRERWYECFTGVCIANASLQEQNELCDAIARRFREHSDGRAGRSWFE